MFRAVLVLCVLCPVAPSPWAAAGEMPTLKYDPPPGFSGGQGWADPQRWVDAMLEGGVDVYAFRPLSADFRSTFDQTLFADRMIATFRQPRLLSRAPAQPVSVAGADDAVMIQFVAVEDYYQYYHARLAVLAGGAVAVIDARARSLERMQTNWPVITATMQSARVLPGGAEGGPNPGEAAQPGRASAVAGLYLGSAIAWQGNPAGGVGGGNWAPGSYWYLLSPDGRVQRGHRLPAVPGGDLRRFDFEAARREAPADGGSFTVEGNRVTFTFAYETLEAQLTPDGNLSIRGSPFRKATLRQP